MDVRIVMFKADGTRRDFPISKSRTVLGRSNNCDLRIPLSSVSRQHCELLIEEDQVSVKDLGSRNGTFLNNTSVTEQILEAGDELAIGSVVFTLVIDGDPDEIEPVQSLVDGNYRRHQENSDTQSETSFVDEGDMKLDAGDSSRDLDGPINSLQPMAGESDDQADR